MPSPNDMKDIASGIAALSICESLLLALNDLKVMRDMPGTRPSYPRNGQSPAYHLTDVSRDGDGDQILPVGNSVRRIERDPA